jgi:hypothetical protein
LNCCIDSFGVVMPAITFGTVSSHIPVKLVSTGGKRVLPNCQCQTYKENLRCR